jgi:hypothetical protein
MKAKTPMIRLAILLMVGGGFLLFIGCKEHRLSSASQAEPQDITAEELIANGYGDNAHVNVTGLQMLDNFVYESSEASPNKYNKVWVPAISNNDPYLRELERVITESEDVESGVLSDALISDLRSIPAPSNFGIIVISDDVENQRELETFAEKTEVRGLVINKIDSLNKDELEVLREQYPGFNDKEVLIIEHNRKPSGAAKTLGMIGGGVVLLLLGPGLMVMSRGN